MEEKNTASREMTVKEWGDEARSRIKDLSFLVKSLMDNGVFRAEQSHRDQHSEMKANVMLAYRHLEDARMRVGKVLQAHDGGVSVYDK